MHFWKCSKNENLKTFYFFVANYNSFLILVASDGLYFLKYTLKDQMLHTI